MVSKFGIQPVYERLQLEELVELFLILINRAKGETWFQISSPASSLSNEAVWERMNMIMNILKIERGSLGHAMMSKYWRRLLNSPKDGDSGLLHVQPSAADMEKKYDDPPTPRAAPKTEVSEIKDTTINRIIVDYPDPVPSPMSDRVRSDYCIKYCGDLARNIIRIVTNRDFQKALSPNAILRLVMTTDNLSSRIKYIQERYQLRRGLPSDQIFALLTIYLDGERIILENSEYGKENKIPRPNGSTSILGVTFPDRNTVTELEMTRVKEELEHLRETDIAAEVVYEMMRRLLALISDGRVITDANDSSEPPEPLSPASTMVREKSDSEQEEPEEPASPASGDEKSDSEDEEPDDSKHDSEEEKDPANPPVAESSSEDDEPEDKKSPKPVRDLTISPREDPDPLGDLASKDLGKPQNKKDPKPKSWFSRFRAAMSKRFDRGPPKNIGSVDKKTGKEMSNPDSSVWTTTYARLKTAFSSLPKDASVALDPVPVDVPRPVIQVKPASKRARELDAMYEQWILGNRNCREFKTVGDVEADTDGIETFETLEAFGERIKFDQSLWHCYDFWKSALGRFVMWTSLAGGVAALQALTGGVSVSLLAGTPFAAQFLAKHATDEPNVTLLDQFRLYTLWRWASLNQDLSQPATMSTRFVNIAKFAINSPFVFPFFDEGEIIELLLQMSHALGAPVCLLRLCSQEDTHTPVFQMARVESSEHKVYWIDLLSDVTEGEYVVSALQARCIPLYNLPILRKGCVKTLDMGKYLRRMKMPENMNEPHWRSFRRSVLLTSELLAPIIRRFSCGANAFPAVPKLDGRMTCLSKVHWMLHQPILTNEYLDRLYAKAKTDERSRDYLTLVREARDMFLAEPSSSRDYFSATWWVHWLGELAPYRKAEITKVLQTIRFLQTDPAFATLFYTPDRATATALSSPRETVITLHPTIPLALCFYTAKPEFARLHTFDGVTREILGHASMYAATFTNPYEWSMCSDPCQRIYLRLRSMNLVHNPLYMIADGSMKLEPFVEPAGEDMKLILRARDSDNEEEAKAYIRNLLKAENDRRVQDLPPISEHHQAIIQALLQRWQQTMQLLQERLQIDPAQKHRKTWLAKLDQQVSATGKQLRDFKASVDLQLAKGKAALAGRKLTADDSSAVSMPLPAKVAPDQAAAFCRTNFPRHPHLHPSRFRVEAGLLKSPKDGDSGLLKFEWFCGNDRWMVQPPQTEFEARGLAAWRGLLETLFGFANAPDEVVRITYRHLEMYKRAKDQEDYIRNLQMKYVEAVRDLTISPENDGEISTWFSLVRSHRIFIGVTNMDEATKVARFYQGLVVTFLHWAKPGVLLMGCAMDSKESSASAKIEWQEHPIASLSKKKPCVAQLHLQAFYWFKGRALASSYDYMRRKFNWTGREHQFDPLLFSLSNADFHKGQRLLEELTVVPIAPDIQSRWQSLQQTAFLQQSSGLTLSEVDLYQGLLRWGQRWQTEMAVVLTELKQRYLQLTRKSLATDAERLEVEALCKAPQFIHYLRRKYQERFPDSKASSMLRSELCTSWLGWESFDAPIGLADLENVPKELTDPTTGLLDLYNTDLGTTMDRWLQKHYGVTVGDLQRYNPLSLVQSYAKDRKHTPDKSLSQLQRLTAFKWLLRTGASECRNVPQHWCGHEVAKDVCRWDTESHVCAAPPGKDGWPVVDLLTQLIQELSFPEVPLGRGDLMLTLELDRMLRQAFTETKTPLPTIKETGFLGHTQTIRLFWKDLCDLIKTFPLAKLVTSYSLPRFFGEERVNKVMSELDVNWKASVSKRSLQIPPFLPKAGVEMTFIRLVALMLYRLHFYKLIEIPST